MKTLNKLTAVSALAATLMLGACADMNTAPNSTMGSAYPQQQNTSSYTQYGVVQSITLVSQNNPTSTTIGAGTIAGAVVGGILGNQVGGGSGKTAATVLGAAGGAYAGHELEKRNQAQQVNAYQLSVRLNNGSYQTLTQSSSNDIRVGDSVRIDNGVATRY
ncbi:MAG: glycine zipper 2TM domain-containing protein [Rhodoferax sp.]|nr:glycine zipper 2TM domain-containing protein [Rhodoferax sp.]